MRWGFLIWESIFIYCGPFVLILVVFCVVSSFTTFRPNFTWRRPEVKFGRNVVKEETTQKTTKMRTKSPQQMKINSLSLFISLNSLNISVKLKFLMIQLILWYQDVLQSHLVGEMKQKNWGSERKVYLLMMDDKYVLKRVCRNFAEIKIGIDGIYHDKAKLNQFLQ